MIFFALFFSTSALYTIKVNESPPFAMCSLPPSGYEVDLIQSALSLYGWRQNEHYNFICSSSNTSYSARVGRVLINSYRYAQGYSYSYPTYNLQLGILAYSSISASTIKFLSIFSIQLWILIPAFSVLIIILLSIFEHFEHLTFASWFKNFQIVSWISISSVFLAEQSHNYRLPSKFIIVGYLSFCLLVMCLYLAGSMVLTFEGVNLIDFPEKLENMRYTTYSAYLDYTATYGGFFVDTGITSSNIEDKISKLENRDIDAIVMEYDTVTKVAKHKCDYVVTSQPFNSFFYAVEIQPEVDDELKNAIDTGIALLNRQFDVESLKNAYFYRESVCSSQLKSVNGVSMYQMIDIFVIYGIIGLCVFILRQLCTTRLLLKERNKHIKNIRNVISKPESKIIKIMQSQTSQKDEEFCTLLQKVEKHLSKSSKIQERILSIVRNKQIKNR